LGPGDPASFVRGSPDIILGVEGMTMSKTKKRDRKQRERIDTPSF